MTLSLGFSPCPNDCFMFDAIVHRRIDLEGLEFDVHLADVEALNRQAFARRGRRHQAELPRLCALRRRPTSLLDAGSALGRGCGPLLISRRAICMRTKWPPAACASPFLAATRPPISCLVWRFPDATNKTEMVFSAIESAVLDGTYDAGLIIHENRFTYEAEGLKKIVDLGEFWERETGAPIPLGGIVINRSLPADDAAARSTASCGAAWSTRSPTPRRAVPSCARMRRR